MNVDHVTIILIHVLCKKKKTIEIHYNKQLMIIMFSVFFYTMCVLCHNIDDKGVYKGRGPKELGLLSAIRKKNKSNK